MLSVLCASDLKRSLYQPFLCQCPISIPPENVFRRYRNRALVWKGWIPRGTFWKCLFQMKNWFENKFWECSQKVEKKADNHIMILMGLPGNCKLSRWWPNTLSKVKKKGSSILQDSHRKNKKRKEKQEISFALAYLITYFMMIQTWMTITMTSANLWTSQ